MVCYGNIPMQSREEASLNIFFLVMTERKNESKFEFRKLRKQTDMMKKAKLNLLIIPFCFFSPISHDEVDEFKKVWKSLFQRQLNKLCRLEL